ncbi:Iron-sulfur cluster assembly ATPase protein SufC [hydrothermal vent metagenome]|uniref:Iron-sulfur cluster assembly ATPase protein SufC n=1 Tax=hydrothermal vent metagenome TaxID=652676 RepID=A0A3B0TQ27_9ZZZZ
MKENKENTAPMLEIVDLHVRVEDKEILKGVNLSVPAGEVHAIMGRNGSGKSTLSYAIAGRQGYEITSGDILLDGQSILAMDVDERAVAGLFLAFQYPIEIPGVATMTFLKAAINAQRKALGKDALSIPAFMKAVREAANELSVDPDMLKRALNVGFSGGEKKRAEVLQMALLKPKMCILDETDSGLDIDALKVVSEGVNRLRSQERSMLVITHYQRLLDHIVPDRVHVFSNGKIVGSGGKELALELENKGYAAFDDVAA